MTRLFRLAGWLLLVGGCVAGAMLGFGWREAHRDPVIRRAAIALPGWPAGRPPVTVALASDIHIGGGAMDAARLRRVMRRIAATRPDLVVLAGDFIDGHDPRTAHANGPALTAALAPLRPPLGIVAVLGNHDNDSDPRAVAVALRRGGATMLENAATARGPLAIGGVGDAYSRHDDLPATLRQLRATPGARLLVTHSPDITPQLPADTPVLLAGHTHCGQVVLPLVGALWIPSDHGARFRCGVIREGARTLVVGAGLGTSMLPIRLGAPPDVWLLTLGPR